jgi:hypothetical protein
MYHARKRRHDSEPEGDQIEAEHAHKYAVQSKITTNTRVGQKAALADGLRVPTTVGMLISLRTTPRCTVPGSKVAPTSTAVGVEHMRVRHTSYGSQPVENRRVN